MCNIELHGSDDGYSPSAMQKALQTFEQRDTSIQSITAAVLQKKIHSTHSTLHDIMYSGKAKEKSSRGPPSYFTEVEEEELTSFFKSYTDIGYNHTLLQTLALVQSSSIER